MIELKEIQSQTRDKKIEVFDENVRIAVLEDSIFNIKTDLDRVKRIFLNLLDNHDDINVTDKPVFLFNEKIIKVKTRLEKESEIYDYFNKFEKVFIYTITESANDKKLDSSGFKFLVVRYATIPENI
jgi:hypothetical protein